MPRERVGVRRQPPAPDLAAAPTVTNAPTLGTHRRTTTTSSNNHLTAASVLDLQRWAGNTAVAGLRPVQRAPLTTAQDPSGYTQPAGVANVQNSGTTRVEVRGLKFGVKGGFQSSYTSTKKDGTTKTRPSAESQMTKESPDNMAVVVMPDKLDANRPVQVVLHFHGWGFRGGTDPYAGYAVGTGGPSAPHGKLGTVRDVDQEHWEQQIGAVNKDRAQIAGPQTVAILAQGRGMSDFGNVPTFDYVSDVLSKVPQLSKVAQYSIVLSGHSGGGDTQVAKKVNSGDAVTTDRTKIPAPQPGSAAQQPSDLVVLFDAEGIESTMSWIVGQITSLTKSVKAAATDKDAQALINASPKFRGYFADGGAYEGRYVVQNKTLGAAVRSVPQRWTLQDTVDPTAIKVEDLFRIIEVSGTGVNHEHTISGGTGGPAEQGALADALRASTDPTRDRTQALPYQPAKPSPQPKTAAPKASAVQKTPAVQRTWKASSATNEYATTQDDKNTLASQTAAERATDRAGFRSVRLVALTKAEKRNKLLPGEDKELADLRALKTRIENSQRALRRKDVEEVLATAGHTVAGWFGNVQKGDFLGIPLRVHQSLAGRLTTAESALVADPRVNPTRQVAKDLGTTLGMYASSSDLRAPAAAVGGNSLSLHTFGLAVDLNYTGNPFLGNASDLAPDVVRRATGLVTGTPVNVMAGLGDTQASYTALKAASDALKIYFSYRDPANAALLAARLAGRSPAKGEPKDAAGWVKLIEKDYAAVAGGKDFRNHKPPEEGFIDLNESVVLALAGAGLTWGGTYGGAKDIMHFDLRQAEGTKIDAARQAHVDNA